MKYCPLCRSRLTPQRVGGMDRIACGALGCGFVHWDNPIPVVAALVEYDGMFVLARNIAWPEGTFSLVTGFLEKHETPEHAVVRELKEELGLDGDIKKFVGHYLLFDLNQIILAFWLTATGRIDIGEEIAEVRHVSNNMFEELAVRSVNGVHSTERQFMTRQSSSPYDGLLILPLAQWCWARRKDLSQ